MYDPTNEDRNQIITRLYNKYGIQMQKIARCILHNPQDVEDAVQNTMAVICEHLHLFFYKDEISVKKLINCIQKNEAIKIYRNNAKNHHLDINDYSLILADNSPYNKAENIQLWLDIKQAISALPKDHKDVFIMANIDDLSVNEIAALLNISADAVYKRLERARKTLRKKLSLTKGGKKR